MFIDRRVFRFKPGRLQEALVLIKANHLRTVQHHSNYKSRYMVGFVASADLFVFESEWNSLAEWEKFWPEWAAHPESSVFWQKLVELLDSNDEHQLWTVVE